MVYDTVSVRQVIAKVLTDNDLHEENHHLADMIEWAGEALEKIGAFPQLEFRVTGKGGEPLLELKNYQAQLPEGIFGITQVAYKPLDGSGDYMYPMRYSSGSFEKVPTITDPRMINSSADWRVGSSSLVGPGEMFMDSDKNLYINSTDIGGTYRNLDSITKLTFLKITNQISEEGLFQVKSVKNFGDIYRFELKEYDNVLLPVNSTVTVEVTLAMTRDEYFYETSRTVEYVYVVTDGYIKTNVRDGYLMISYTRIPLDEEGYPKVPNKMSFLEAIYWYITMKMNYPKWVTGELRDGVFFEMRRAWNFYRKQAYAEAMMPEGDQLNAIKYTWNQLIPELNAQNNFYSGVGEQEVIYNQNKRTWPLLYNRSTRV